MVGRRSNSPSGGFSFWNGHRHCAVLQVLVLSVLHSNHLTIPLDSWCNFSTSYTCEEQTHIWNWANFPSLSFPGLGNIELELLACREHPLLVSLQWGKRNIPYTFAANQVFFSFHPLSGWFIGLWAQPRSAMLTSLAGLECCCPGLSLQLFNWLYFLPPVSGWILLLSLTADTRQLCKTQQKPQLRLINAKTASERWITDLLLQKFLGRFLQILLK